MVQAANLVRRRVTPRDARRLDAVGPKWNLIVCGAVTQWRCCAKVRTLAVLCASFVIVSGCSASRGTQDSRARHGSTVRLASLNPALVRAQAMAVADTYSTVVAAALDELRRKTARPAVVEWALEQRIYTAHASMTNATASNEYVGLVDMLVLAKLKRHALEDHWKPTLLREEGDAVLEAYRRGEEIVWTMGGKTLSGGQLKQLRELIDGWRRDNPTQYYVSHIRLTDVAISMRVGADSPQVKIPGNVFGLLYMDPLAGLDPVTRELRDYRALADRVIYLAARMPIVLSWQMELLALQATGGPQIVSFAQSTAKFADATAQVAAATTQTADAISRTADNVAKLPPELSAERQAAIDQLNVVVAAQTKTAIEQTLAGVNLQREAITKEVEAQQSALRLLVADVKGVVDTANQAGLSLNAATGQTVATTEVATRRTLQLAFTLALILIVVILAGIPLSILFYRVAARRWANPQSLKGEQSGGA